MDLYNLIPFFLTIAVPESYYTHNGPKYIFDLNVETTTKPLFSKITSHFHVQNNLICYPTAYDYKLLCHLGEFHANGENVQYFEMYRDLNDWSEQYFEIQFNNNSISNLTVSMNLKTWHMNVIRAIAGQFNVGIPFQKKQLIFTGTEETYFGDCESYVTIYTQDNKNNSRSREHFVLTPVAKIPIIVIEKGKQLVIEKSRSMAFCDHATPYMFSTENDEPENLKLESTHNIMTITPNSFYSYTLNTFAKKLNKKYQMFYEKITLNLVRVQPARKNIPRPLYVNTVIGPYVFGDIRGYLIK